jgi:hypothetical protein
MINAFDNLKKKLQAIQIKVFQKSIIVEDEEIKEALEQAEKEIMDGSAVLYADVDQLFRESGWVTEDKISKSKF